MLNRALVILRPEQPLLDWNAALPGPKPPLGERGDEVAYLIPAFESYEGAEEVLRDVWPVLFERTLGAYCLDVDRWPAKPTYEMFRRWLKVELHSIVEDVGDEPLEDDGIDGSFDG